MAVYAAIGGMQLWRWTGYFRIIVPTLRVLKAAKRAEGCVLADTFKAGDVFFAVSVWDTVESMQAFAKGGLHGRLTHVAMDHMALFFNHTQEFDAPPDRTQSERAWRDAIAMRNGRGTVGIYNASA